MSKQWRKSSDKTKNKRESQVEKFYFEATPLKIKMSILSPQFISTYFWFYFSSFDEFHFILDRFVYLMIFVEIFWSKPRRVKIEFAQLTSVFQHHRKQFNFKFNLRRNPQNSFEKFASSMERGTRSFIQINGRYLTMIIKPMQVLLHFRILRQD